MKTNLKVLLLLFLGISSNIFSQCSQQTTFQKAYGGSGNERAHSIDLTSDGGYIIAGETTSFGAGNKDWFVMKIDANGVEQWSKTYGTSSVEDGFSITIKQTNDLGYILCGYTEGFGAGSYFDSFIIKIDNVGTIQWEKRIAGSSYDQFRDVIELSNGDFVLTGSGQSYSAGQMDAHVVKISSTGNLIWIKNLGTSSREHSQSIIELPGGNYLLSGTSNYSDPGSSTANAYLSKIDHNGNFIFGRQYGLTSFYDDFNEIKLLSDGNILNIGETASYGVGNFDILLVKTDTSGNVIWSKTYGGTGIDIGVNVNEKLNGELLISAYTSSYGLNNQLLLINTNSVGNIIWSKTYGGPNLEELDWCGKPMVLTPNGGIIIAGSTSSFGSGNEDVYIVKTNECGESFCNEQNVVLTSTSPNIIATLLNEVNTSGGTLVNTNAIVNTINFTESLLCDSLLISINKFSDLNAISSIYPNPAFNMINVKMDKDIEIQNIEIYNVTGQKIDIKSFDKTSEFIQIDISNLSEGLYFLKVYNKDKILGTSKFIKQHN